MEKKTHKADGKDKEQNTNEAKGKSFRIFGSQSEGGAFESRLCIMSRLCATDEAAVESSSTIHFKAQTSWPPFIVM